MQRYKWSQILINIPILIFALWQLQHATLPSNDIDTVQNYIIDIKVVDRDDCKIGSQFEEIDDLNIMKAV